MTTYYDLVDSEDDNVYNFCENVIYCYCAMAVTGVLSMIIYKIS